MSATPFEIPVNAEEAAWIRNRVAAWLAEKFADPMLSLNWLLTNIMIYLATSSFLTVTWLYRGMFWEIGHDIPVGQRTSAPTGVANFPKDILAFPPRSLVERGYDVVHWTDMPRGGHFASLEEPELFLADVRKFAAGL